MKTNLPPGLLTRLIQSFATRILLALACLFGAGDRQACAVINGTELTLAEFNVQTPWLAVVEDALGRKCTGTMIAPRWVLTAAHCLPVTHVRLSHPDSTQAQQFQVVDAIRHPGYRDDDPYLGYDVALLKIDGVYTGALPQLSKPDFDPPANSIADIAGWGLMEGGQLPSLARQGTVRLESVSSLLWIASPAPSMIASGDSGGPLFIRPITGPAVLIGITSFDSGLNQFGGFTRVSSMHSWILDHTDPIIVENPIPDQTASYLRPFDFVVPPGTFVHPVPGTVLTYSAVGLPDGISMDASGIFTGAPIQAGSFNITVSATDGMAPPRTTSDTFVLRAAKAAINVTANGAVRFQGQPNPSFNGAVNVTLGGGRVLTQQEVGNLLAFENLVPAYACAATQASPLGEYPIVPMLTDPRGRLANYELTTAPGSLSVVPAPDCSPTPSDLISWWRGEGNTDDNEGVNSPTEILGAPQFVTGKVGQGIQLDGGSGFAISDRNGLDFGASASFTVILWVRVDQVLATPSILIDKRRIGGGLGYGMGMLGTDAGADSRSFYVSLQDGVTSHSLQSPPTAVGEFHHLAVVIDRTGNLASLYLDGAPSASQSLSGFGSLANDGRCFVGHQSLDVLGTSGRPLNGMLDELAMFDRALSASEILAVYNAGSAGFCTSPPNCVVSPSGLVSSWRAENNANDSEGVNIGTLQNGTPFAPGKVGQGFGFDGADDYVSVPDSETVRVQQALTIEGWVYASDQLSGLSGIAGKWNDIQGNFRSYMLWASSGQLQMYVASDPANLASYATANIQIPIRQWVHVAGTYDGQFIRVYQNGQLAGTTAFVGPIATNTRPFYIGLTEAAGTARYWRGAIDELSLYDRALTANEIADIYNAGSAGKCVTSPLVLLPAGSITTAANGTIAFNASGGTPPYAFTIVNDPSVGSINSVSGVYFAGNQCGLTDTVRVTDTSGNTANATVQIIDALPPVIVRPQDILAELTAPDATVVTFAPPTVTDDCATPPSVVCTPPSGSTFSNGTTPVNCTANDSSGNSASCSFNVLVRDTTPPDITACAPSQNLGALNDCRAVLPSYVDMVLATDASPIVIQQNPAPGAALGIGTHLITFTALDGWGNFATCSAQVTVRDMLPPSISTLPNVTLSVGANCQAALPDLTSQVAVFDACGAVTVTQSPPPGTMLGVDFQLITYTATDAAGNTATRAEYTRVIDSTPPVLTCPADLVLECTSPQGAVAIFTPTATDNCDQHPFVACSHRSGEVFRLGVTPVFCEVTDSGGNSSQCSFTVTVRDTVAPVIVWCAPDRTLPAGADCQVAAPDLRLEVGAFDTCGPVTVTQNPAPETPLGLGAHTLTLTVRDDAGNESSCMATVTVRDLTPPLIAVCPPDQNLEAEVSGQAVLPDYTATTVVTDSCGPVALAQTPAPGTPLALGTHLIALMASDAQGNETPCSFSAVVRPKTFIVSGRITAASSGGPSAGVPVILSITAPTARQLRTTTDAQGNYSFPNISAGSSGYLFPSGSGFTFLPGSRFFSTLASDAFYPFVAVSKSWISGRVADTHGVGLDGMTLQLNKDGRSLATTKATQGGLYRFGPLDPGLYSLEPRGGRFTFDPTGANLLLSQGDIVQNFIGTPIVATAGRIVFRPRAPRSSPHLVNPDGSGLLRLNPLTSDDHGLVWSSDGTRLAFYRNPAGLCVANADGSEIKYYGHYGNYQSPTWSPDGAKLAILGVTAGRLQSGIFLVDPDTGAAQLILERRISHGLTDFVVWSPRGDRLGAFISDRLYIIQPSGTILTEFPQSFIDDAGVRVFLRNLQWSPDGTTLTAHDNNGTGTYSSSVSPLSFQRWLSTASWATSWSPDGRALASSSPDYQIFTIDLDSRIGSPLADGYIQAGCWGRDPVKTTPAGLNIVSTMGNASVQFGNVVSGGGTTIKPISPQSLPVDSGVFKVGSMTAYEISTTATINGPIVVTFTVPPMSKSKFRQLAVLHGETDLITGRYAMVDRTIRLPEAPAPDYAKLRISARVTSLSPFMVGELVDTTLLQVKGFVVATNGVPLSDVEILLTGDGTNVVETSVDGSFAIPNLESNVTYTLTAHAPGYSMQPGSFTLSNLDTNAEIVFIAEPLPPVHVPNLSISLEDTLDGQVSLTWPARPFEFLLESTDSLTTTNWSPVLELPTPLDDGVAVPLLPSEARRFFRLRSP